ncbi:hypothetical protein HFO10_17140 [Rhizobium laguerreae]|uniref:caspase family protein n=1 Tax=Rhizobium laguerreae TaxID=1076926 RepID=UPI001C91659B|nr:caspase family protein [Rhizobium laguerreae]MBY3297649.1 hypothetical protein [Rhizobium laguerreae]
MAEVAKTVVLAAAFGLASVAAWNAASAMTAGDPTVQLYVESGIHHSARSVAFSADNAYLAASSLDRTIKVWDVATGRELATLPNQSMARSIAFLPTGTVLAAANEDGSVAIWDFPSLTQKKTVQCSSRDNATVAVAAEAGYLLCADPETQIIHRWNVSSWVPLTDIELPTALRGDSLILLDGAHAAAIRDQQISVIDLKSLEIEATFPAQDLMPDTSLALSWKAKMFAVATSYDSITLHAEIGAKAAGPGLTIPASGVHAIAFSADGGEIAYASESGDIVFLRSNDGQETARLTSNSNRIENAGVDATTSFLSVHLWYDAHMNFDLHTGGITNDPAVSLNYDNGTEFTSDAAFNNRRFGIRNRQDYLQLETEEGQPICTIVILDKIGKFVVVAPDGRFDTNMDLADVKGVHWVFAGDLLKPVPLEILMRDYYTPKLLARLLGGQAMPSLPRLSDLNRVQPSVTISAIAVDPLQRVALVTIEGKNGKDPSQTNGKTSTGLYDVRLFRDGQLAGQWPEPSMKGFSPDGVVDWREKSSIDVPAGKLAANHTFAVRLASTSQNKKVTFTAYGFNEDRVKSQTAVVSVDSVAASAPVVRRAYVIAVGVNAYRDPDLQLNFASADATSIAMAMQRLKGFEVVPVLLTSDVERKTDGTLTPAVDHARKADIRDVLALLAGQGEDNRDRLRKALGPVVDKLSKVTPDDLVVLAFSGHGYTEQGSFFILPSDSGDDLTHHEAMISSEELTAWLRNVDAGEMVMIIDACHSAAGVPEGFKPGPMGDRGLGQLAYDKRMRILAATQADDVAIESGALGQGLLTYALVKEGLSANTDGKLAADGDKDGAVSMKEWLTHAQDRVPSLYQDLLSGKVKITKDSNPNPDLLQDTERHAQTPVLFDFGKEADATIFTERQ